MSISFRTEHITAELHAFVDLEMAIWGADARDAVPMTLLRALLNNGGVLVGAYAGSRPVGMALGFPARRGSRWLLWSHSSGVHPRYQRQGIGLALKQHQRQWALANGFDHMRWTFDPLQAGNAWFNLVLLGAHADTYHVDYYGEMTDSLNTGLPSDRVEAVWNLKRKNTKHPPAPSVNQQAAILSADSAGLPLAAPPANPDMQQHYVEIPAQISALDRQTAVLSWRLALRAVLQPALTSGSTLTGFQRDGGRCWYVLTTPAPWFLYVLECSDGSLYTGITTEVERRLAAHNAGRGAAYTAARRPVRCLGSWRFANHSDALRAEAAFKRQPRAAKLERLRQQGAFQGGIFVRGLYGAW